MDEIRLASGGTVRVCKMCAQPFLTYDKGGMPQKMCPSCVDEKECRPSIVQERLVVEEFDGVKIFSLPCAEWEKFTADPSQGDFPCFKMDIRGRRFGAAWQGRIVIYAPQPWAVGAIVNLREMLARHTVRAIRGTRPTLHGSVMTRKVVPVQGENGKLEIEQRPYIVLDPPTANEQIEGRQLAWLVHGKKTTLKGFGRQHHSWLVGSPLWKKQVSGGVRSGRIRWTGTLAVVDPDHWLKVRRLQADTGERGGCPG